MPTWSIKIGLEATASDPRGPWWGWIVLILVLLAVVALFAF